MLVVTIIATEKTLLVQCPKGQMGIPRLGLKVEAKGTSRKGELGYLFQAFGWRSLQMELKEVTAARAGGPVRMPESALLMISCGQTASYPVNCPV